VHQAKRSALPLLPNVSIVDWKMRQALPAVALALALVCTALLTCTLLAERLWSSAQLDVPPNATPKPTGWQARAAWV